MIDDRFTPIWCDTSSHKHTQTHLIQLLNKGLWMTQPDQHVDFPTPSNHCPIANWYNYLRGISGICPTSHSSFLLRYVGPRLSAFPKILTLVDCWLTTANKSVCVPLIKPVADMICIDTSRIPSDDIDIDLETSHTISIVQEAHKVPPLPGSTRSAAASDRIAA